MGENFNELNPAKTERLAILAEECAEVIQIVGKILRHGYESHNPSLPEMKQKPNRAILEKELGDLLWIICKMDDATDINFQIPRTNASLNMWLRRKEESARKYLHHQNTAAPSSTASDKGEHATGAGVVAERDSNHEPRNED